MAFGKPEDFHFEESEESFDNYRERLEHYFAANDLDTEEEKTKSVFLTVVGKRSHSLLMDLCAPGKPSEKSYEELVELLQRHFIPKTNFIAERCKFHGRNQKDDETISEYVASLRKLAATCKFGTFLDEALRDRVVCGVKSSELRDRLLSAARTQDLTLPLAVEMAFSFEATKDSAQQFAQKAFKAHVVEKKATTKYSEAEKNAATGKPCYRCGGKNHHPSACRFKESECHECKKKGHIARACRTRKEGGRSSTTKGTMHLDVKKRPSAFKQWSCQNISALQQQDVCSWTGPQYPPEDAPLHDDPDNRREFKGDPHRTQFLSHHVREDRAASDVLVRCQMEPAPNSDTVPDLTLDSPDVGFFEMNTDRARVAGGLPDVVTIQEGKALNLTCNISGNPVPEVTWLKNDREITSDEHCILKFESGKFASFTITAVNTSDSGKYSILVKNKYGTESGDFTLEVTEGTPDLGVTSYWTDAEGNVVFGPSTPKEKMKTTITGTKPQKQKETAAEASTKKVEDKKRSIKGELKEKITTEDVMTESKVSDPEPPEDEKEDLGDQQPTQDNSDVHKQPETAEEPETEIKTA